jgi:hypothetical protein
MDGYRIRALKPRKDSAMFNVTYEIVTEESASDGDSAESGFIAKNVPLRSAFDYVTQSRTSENSGVFCVESSDSNNRHARWVTVGFGMEYLTGACESRSLHFPEKLTPSTRGRITRLLRG